jgi:hypothetical protein
VDGGVEYTTVSDVCVCVQLTVHNAGAGVARTWCKARPVSWTVDQLPQGHSYRVHLIHHL